MQKRLFIETFGCQMNVADSEAVAAILREKDYILTSSDADADAILINTGSVRDNAEQRIWGRLDLFRRSSQNEVVVFPDKGFLKGDYVNVSIKDCTQTTLIGELTATSRNR